MSWGNAKVGLLDCLEGGREGGGEREVCVSLRVCVCVSGGPVETGGVLFYPTLCPINIQSQRNKQCAMMFDQLWAQVGLKLL